MNAMLAEFHFLRPWWLIALAALPLLWVALTRRGADASAWRHAVDAHLLRHLLVQGAEEKSARALPWLALVAWVVAVVALAGPAWEQLPQPLFQNRAARVIALELGPSMAAQDIKPSRFERARYKIADLLKHNGDAQTALIAYAGDAFVVAPLTDDVNTVANLVDALDPSVMPVPGNDTGRAIDLAIRLIKGGGLDQGDIILLADGAGGTGVQGAWRARAAGMRVSVLGVGSAQGAPVPLPQGGFLKDSLGDIVLPKLDAASLEAVAEAGAGRYTDITGDASDIEHVLGGSALHPGVNARATQATTTRYLDRGPWLALLLLPFGACAFRRGWLLLLPLVLCAHARPAAAMSWQDLWSRPDQQARSALDAGNAAQAQALAREPQLRGAAAYRASDFPAAAADFQRGGDADAAYNNGNALVREGQFQQALAAYDQALQREPGMADALANKKTVEDWLKQQQEQQQQQKQESKDHQGHEQAQAGSSGSGDDQDQKQQAQAGDKSQRENSGQGQQQGQQAQSEDSRQAQKDAAQSDDHSDAKAAQVQAAEPDEQARQRFGESMSSALEKGKEQAGKQPDVRLGAAEADKPQDEHEQAIQQWLQRVPDDPGGLLRRKFQLEYQRRQRGGNLPGDDGP